MNHPSGQNCFTSVFNNQRFSFSSTGSHFSPQFGLSDIFVPDILTQTPSGTQRAPRAYFKKMRSRSMYCGHHNDTQ